MNFAVAEAVNESHPVVLNASTMPVVKPAGQFQLIDAIPFVALLVTGKQNLGATVPFDGRAAASKIIK